MAWTQHKYDADQYVNMCISFHVDLYCIFILFLVFCFFVINDACHQGPVSCLPHCFAVCAVQGQRCSIWVCGIFGSKGPEAEEGTVSVPAEGPESSSRKS